MVKRVSCENEQLAKDIDIKTFNAMLQPIAESEVGRNDYANCYCYGPAYPPCN